MKIVEREFVQELDVAAAVAVWNFWDGEHLTVVHKGYVNSKVLLETRSLSISLTKFRVPIFSFLTSKSMSTIVLEELREDGGATFKNFNHGLLAIPSVTTIRVEALGENRCRITSRYQFYLDGPQRLLAPIIYRMMASWNAQVWIEDLPLKLRRHQVLRAGFRDFVGMPDRVADRHREGTLKTGFPVPRPKEAPINEYLKNPTSPPE
jgi:hypothetical protein